MKLSDIRGERVIDTVADLIEPVTNIAMDEQAAKLFKREKCPEGVEPRDFMLGRVRESLPKLLKDHHADVVAILAALEGETPEEYERDLTLAKLMGGFMEAFTDEDLLAFLS